jgi:hypothetical protein
MAIIGSIDHPFLLQELIGQAYVFTRSGSSWIQRIRLTPELNGRCDGFGAPVAIWGDLAYVSAPLDPEPELGSGSVYAFNLMNLSPAPTPTPVPINNAVFLAHSVPAQLPAGRTFPVTFTVQNAGDTTWTAVEGYSLAVTSDGAGILASDRIELPAEASISPAGSVLFSTSLDVPDFPAAENGDGGLPDPVLVLRMTQDGGQGLFGPTLSISAELVGPVNGAEVLNSTIPAIMTHARTLYVGITIRNTGNVPWHTDSGHALAVVDSTCMIPSATRIVVREGDIVLPGATYQFILALRAPAEPGMCEIQFQMVQEFVEFFGEPLTAMVEIVSPPNAAPGWARYE